jgi:hypothetical protein
MSMPELLDSSKLLTKEQAIISILTSIAMEEAALSHIINAEGEKIQYALNNKCNDIQKIIEVNESVSSILNQIIDMQLLLKIKFQKVAVFLSPQPERPCSLFKPDRTCI